MASEEPLWDKFVRTHSGGALTYSMAYRALLSACLAGHADYRGVWQQGDLIGILPMFRTSGRYGDVVNSLPFFGSAGSPLAVTEAALRALAETWETIVEDPDVVSAVSLGHPFGHLDYQLAHNVQDHRVGQFTRLDNAGGADALFSQFDSSARRNVRRGLKSGATVVVDNDAVDFLQALHIDNMQAIGGRAKPLAFFDNFPSLFLRDRDYQIYVARNGNVQTAALLVFYYAGKAEYFIPAVSQSAREDQPMALILWTAMQEAIARGCTIWNWGGTWTSQTGVYRFKKKWAADETPYTYDIYLKRDALAGAKLSDLMECYPGYYVAPESLLKEWAAV